MRDKLATDPDDDASLQWGKFLAYFKSQWGDGLPLLATGSDEKLSKLRVRIRQIQGRYRTDERWRCVVCGWRGRAESAGPKEPLASRKFWYDQAQSSLTGFNKTKVDKRIKEIEALLPKVESESTTSTASTKAVNPKSEFASIMQSAAYAYKAGRYGDAAVVTARRWPSTPTAPRRENGLKQSLYAEALARGVMYANQGKLQEAASEFRKALEEIPSDPTAEQYLAWANNGGKGNQGGPGSGMRRKR